MSQYSVKFSNTKHLALIQAVQSVWLQQLAQVFQSYQPGLCCIKVQRVQMVLLYGRPHHRGSPCEKWNAAQTNCMTVCFYWRLLEKTTSNIEPKKCQSLQDQFCLDEGKMAKEKKELEAISFCGSILRSVLPNTVFCAHEETARHHLHS